MRLLVEAVAVIILALPALGPEGIPRQSASGCRRTGLAAGPAVHSPVSILVRVQAQIEEIGGQTKSPSDGPVPTSTTFFLNFEKTQKCSELNLISNDELFKLAGR
jgi:hypothetical protein